MFAVTQAPLRLPRRPSISALQISDRSHSRWPIMARTHSRFMLWLTLLQTMHMPEELLHVIWTVGFRACILQDDVSYVKCSSISFSSSSWWLGGKR